MTLHFFEEFSIYAEITGFKKISSEQATLYLKNNRKTGPQNIWIQFFNPNLIATYKHLYFAILTALHAFRNYTNLSKSIAMETMLYASAQHQIQKAIEVIGLTPNMHEMAITIIGENPKQIQSVLTDLTNSLQTEPCNAVLALTPKKIDQIQQAFNITPIMIKVTTKNNKDAIALVNLIIEKIALLATKF